jgi:hypothetical protein
MKIGENAFNGTVIAILKNEIWIKRENLSDLIVKYKSKMAK